MHRTILIIVKLFFVNDYIQPLQSLLSHLFIVRFMFCDLIIAQCLFANNNKKSKSIEFDINRYNGMIL